MRQPYDSAFPLIKMTELVLFLSLIQYLRIDIFMKNTHDQHSQVNILTCMCAGRPRFVIL